MKEMSLSEYINLDREINAYRGKKRQKKVKIAILGSFTLNGFKEVLNVKCHNMGIKTSFYVNDYNQYASALINKNSKFYRFKPDITYLLVDIKSIVGEHYFDPYGSSERKRRELVRNNYKRLHGLIKRFTQYGRGILVVNNFEVPVYSPIGILESKERFGYFDMIKALNAQISRFNKYSSVFVFDYDSFISKIGKRNISDNTLLYLADMKIAPDMIPALCEEYIRYIKVLKGLAKKCLVLDMDNTLWGGIVGEDGFEGIKLGPTAPGNAYMEFQKYILALFHRGVILAINSNNNREDVFKVLREHPYMVLKEHHFASIKVNWQNKVKNLVDIAKDINIGLDSIIYLDDDKRNRQIVKEALPEVSCPDLPENASEYPRFLTEIKDLDVLQITPEDRKRGRLYVAERRRKESARSFKNLSQYLKRLNIVVEIKLADRFSIPRVSQLTLRTNQFNFSTKRYSEEEIERFLKDKKYSIYYIKVKDRYGEYGITGALIVLKKGKSWFVDTFLLSCRVLGRNVEDAVLSDVIRRAIKEGADKVEVGYAKTQKNQPVGEFLKKYGISVNKESQKREISITLYEKGQRNKSKDNLNLKVISQ